MLIFSRRLPVVGAFAASLAACGGHGPTPLSKLDLHGSIVPGRSTAAEREKLSITVYNGNFGLVREVRQISLPKGRVELEFNDVAEHIEPETVHIKSLSSAGALAVFEQNYRYDFLSPQKLLEKYVNKMVRLHRWNEKLGREEDFDAYVVSVNESPIFRINGEITYGFPGRISFPEVPANLIAKPTLVWLLGSGEARQRVEVTYITQEMNWKSDYVLSIDASDKVADLTGCRTSLRCRASRCTGTR